MKNTKWIIAGAYMALSLSATGFAANQDVQEAEGSAAAEAVAVYEEGKTESRIFSAAEAADWLEPALGDWYDMKGNQVMVVSAEAINDCPIVGLKDMVYDYPRTGSVTVREAAGDKTIKMDILGHKSHQYIILNDRTPLRRSVHGDHYESVGGLHLGMTKEEVTAAYGQPDRVVQDQNTKSWAYDSHHMELLIQGNIVMAVRIYKDSDLTFAQSGLGAADTPEAYAAAYGLESVPHIPAGEDAISQAYSIPQGEWLYFGNDFVELSVFS